uniref:Uncharacterized protein n=1 Tax=Rhizophora mucronata TaxID=61149 RepID=A0A2P2IV22_RHIMU
MCVKELLRKLPHIRERCLNIMRRTVTSDPFTILSLRFWNFDDY